MNEASKINKDSPFPKGRKYNSPSDWLSSEHEKWEFSKVVIGTSSESKTFKFRSWQPIDDVAINLGNDSYSVVAQLIANSTTELTEENRKTILFKEKHKLESLLKKLESYIELKPNWDSYGSEPPNSTAIQNAKIALEIMKLNGNLPNTINPSSDEGIGFEFFKKERYYSIEFFNDGEIVYSKKDENNEIKVVEIKIDDIPTIVLEII